METNEIQARQRAKSNEAQLERVLEQEYHLAPRVAQAIIQEVQVHLYAEKNDVEAGHMMVNVARHDAGHGQALTRVPTVVVRWTVDAGEQDREVARQQGQAVLRRQRIVRLLEEALAQGGVATQEDLATALGVSVRTIKRDFATLHQSGHVLPSRGYRRGIGRGQSHKVRIIQRWLDGATYDQIMAQTHHSLNAIQRYIQTFARIVDLHRTGLVPEQISFITQTGVQLVQRYLDIYQDVMQRPHQCARLEAQLKRMTNGSLPVKKRRVA